MAEPLGEEGGGEETGVPGKNPGYQLQKMPHTKARRFRPHARLEPAQQHCGQAGKVDVLTVAPRVARFGS